MDDLSKPRSVLFLPDWREQPYLSLLASGLAHSGWSVSYDNYPNTTWAINKSANKHDKAEVLHLHWTTGLYSPFFWASSAWKFYAKSLQLYFDVLIARLRGRKVVWTVHNLVNHESPDMRREIFLNRVLAKAVSALVFHSASAREEFENQLGISLTKKSAVIPHGNYIDWYRMDQAIFERLKTRYDVKNDDLVFIVFGAVRRYKGITELLKAFVKAENPRARLIVAGKPNELDLQHELETLAENQENIYLDFRFIPDEEVAPLFALGTAALFGFERTLTSGSALLAMSMGLPLVLPDIAKVFDICDEDGAWFYSASGELSELMARMDISKASEMGAYNLAHAQQLCWIRIGATIANAYQN